MKGPKGADPTHQSSLAVLHLTISICEWRGTNITKSIRSYNIKQNSSQIPLSREIHHDCKWKPKSTVVKIKIIEKYDVRLECRN